MRQNKIIWISVIISLVLALNVDAQQCASAGGVCYGFAGTPCCSGLVCEQGMPTNPDQGGICVIANCNNDGVCDKKTESAATCPGDCVYQWIKTDCIIDTDNPQHDEYICNLTPYYPVSKDIQEMLVRVEVETKSGATSPSIEVDCTELELDYKTCEECQINESNALFEAICLGYDTTYIRYDCPLGCFNGECRQCSSDYDCLVLGGDYYCDRSSGFGICRNRYEITIDSCKFKSSCSAGETCALSAYKPVDSHVADCSTNLPYQDCCPKVDGCSVSCEIKSACSAGETEALSLYSFDNSHGADLGEYSQRLCCHAVGSCASGGLSCSLTTPSDCNKNFQVCVASVNGVSNAHLGECGSYYNDICCNFDAAGGPFVCGNNHCDPGEADSCPACYYSTPPCLMPCQAGTCPQDCVTTTPSCPHDLANLGCPKGCKICGGMCTSPADTCTGSIV